MSELTNAINHVNHNHPLPRCVHDQALADHSGEQLAPPCGCRLSYRTKELDYDARRQSKTDRACVRCQRDIKPSSPARGVHLVDGGNFILHPDDEEKYQQANPRGHGGDLGAWLLGMDCARQIGLEWSTPA